MSRERNSVMRIILYLDDGSKNSEVFQPNCPISKEELIRAIESTGCLSCCSRLAVKQVKNTDFTYDEDDVYKANNPLNLNGTQRAVAESLFVVYNENSRKYANKEELKEYCLYIDHKLTDNTFYSRISELRNKFLTISGLLKGTHEFVPHSRTKHGYKFEPYHQR